MLALFLALSPTASAADAQPALFGFSARPNDSVAVESQAFGVVVGLPFTDMRTGYGGGVRGTIPLTDRVTFDLRAGVLQEQGCGSQLERTLGPRCFEARRFDGVGRLGVAVLQGSRARLMPYVGVGTTLEAGVAAWWRSPDERFELDFAWGLAVHTEALIPGDPDNWQEVQRPAPNLYVREDASLPEIGLTLHLDDRDLHHLRFGHLAHIPTLGYRVDPGPVSVELSAGVIFAGAMVSGGVGGVF